MERESVCVLGGGSTKYGKLDDSISDITLQASVGAIESAGIEPKEIQAGYVLHVLHVLPHHDLHHDALLLYE